MTVASTVSRVDYTGAGNTNTYDYTFRIFDESELLVTVRDTDDIETRLTLTTDYTVTGVGASDGGTIVLVSANQAWLESDGDLKSGYALSIRRVCELTQETDIRNQGAFFPETHENVFDKLTFIDQQQQDEIGRSIKLPETVDPEDVDTHLPLPSPGLAIGWNSSGDGLVNLADAGSVAISAFGESLVDDLNAAAARTTLDVSQAINSLTEETSPDFADFFLARDTSAAADRKMLLANLIKLVGQNPSFLSNYSISCSVGSNALTISLKNAAGSDASSSSPIYASFRNPTAATGTFALRQATSALSLTISSGSTLGHSSGNDHYIYVYLIDNAGTLELGASSSIFDEGTLQSSSAEGGAGAADSGAVLYSAAARANKAIRLVGRLKSNQVTAGTWAALPTEIALAPFLKQRVVAKYSKGNNQALATATETRIDFENKVIDTHNAVTVGASWVFTAPKTSNYRVSFFCRLAVESGFQIGEEAYALLYKNASASEYLDFWYPHQSSVALPAVLKGTTIIDMAAGDSLHIKVFQNSGFTVNTSATTGIPSISIEEIGPY
jgi:hypothetical protein